MAACPCQVALDEESATKSFAFQRIVRDLLWWHLDRLSCSVIESIRYQSKTGNEGAHDSDGHEPMTAECD